MHYEKYGGYKGDIVKFCPWCGKALMETPRKHPERYKNVFTDTPKNEAIKKQFRDEDPG